VHYSRRETTSCVDDAVAESFELVGICGNTTDGLAITKDSVKVYFYDVAFIQKRQCLIDSIDA